MKGPEAFQQPQAAVEAEAQPTREEAYGDVAERAETLLASLDEALETYTEVSVPCGETMTADATCDKLVARAQIMREGLEHLVEQQREGNSHHGEKAAALTVAAIEHVEGLLMAQADLAHEAERNPAAARLHATVEHIAHTLLTPEAANDATIEGRTDA